MRAAVRHGMACNKILGVLRRVPGVGDITRLDCAQRASATIISPRHHNVAPRKSTANSSPSRESIPEINRANRAGATNRQPAWRANSPRLVSSGSLGRELSSTHELPPGWSPSAYKIERRAINIARKRVTRPRAA